MTLPSDLRLGGRQSLSSAACAPWAGKWAKIATRTSRAAAQCLRTGIYELTSGLTVFSHGST